MGEAAKKDTEEKFVMVGPAADDLPDADARVETPDEDKAPSADERLGGGREVEPEQDHERPRETSRERRDRQKRANERIRRELEQTKSQNSELIQRVARLEGRSSQAEVTASEQRMTALKSQINNAGRVMAEAMVAAGGGDKDARSHYEQALQIRDDLQRELMRMETQHEGRGESELQQQPRAAQSPTQGGALDPLAKALGRKWIKDHPWFDPAGEDEDSEIVFLIEQRMRREGFNPADEEHWEELEARVRKRLPDRFKGKAARGRREEDADDLDDDEDAESRQRPVSARSAGPRFSSGGRERPLRKGEVYVSAERKQAMQLAGAWEDPDKRQKLLKAYADMDAQLAREKAG